MPRGIAGTSPTSAATNGSNGNPGSQIHAKEVDEGREHDLQPGIDLVPCDECQTDYDEDVCGSCHLPSSLPDKPRFPRGLRAIRRPSCHSGNVPTAHRGPAFERPGGCGSEPSSLSATFGFRDHRVTQPTNATFRPALASSASSTFSRRAADSAQEPGVPSRRPRTYRTERDASGGHDPTLPGMLARASTRLKTESVAYSVSVDPAAKVGTSVRLVDPTDGGRRSGPDAREEQRRHLSARARARPRQGCRGAPGAGARRAVRASGGLLTETTLLSLLAGARASAWRSGCSTCWPPRTSRCRFRSRSILAPTGAFSSSRSASRSWRGPCSVWCRRCRAPGRTWPAPCGVRSGRRPARSAPVAQHAGHRAAHDLARAARRGRPLPPQLPARCSRPTQPSTATRPPSRPSSRRPPGSHPTRRGSLRGACSAASGSCPSSRRSAPSATCTCTRSTLAPATSTSTASSRRRTTAPSSRTGPTSTRLLRRGRHRDAPRAQLRRRRRPGGAAARRRSPRLGVAVASDAKVRTLGEAPRNIVYVPYSSGSHGRWQSWRGRRRTRSGRRSRS